MSIPDRRTWLAFYSGAVTAALAAVLLVGAGPRRARFETLEVQRLDVVEPDGTLRLALSSKARFPGLIFRKKEYEHDRPSAGLLFFNEEGTENGGLIFGGRRGTDGKGAGGLHLSFDQYEQDQVVTLTHQEESGSRMAGLSVMDRPESAMDLAAFERFKAMPPGPAKDAAEKDLANRGFRGVGRVFVGKTRDRAATLELKDVEGRPRLVLRVAPDGEASMAFLGPDGRELARLPSPPSRP